jgi:spermidine synthase
MRQETSRACDEHRAEEDETGIDHRIIGRTTCKKAERNPSDEVQADLKYYSPELHQAAFVLPAFARREFLGGK